LQYIEDGHLNNAKEQIGTYNRKAVAPQKQRQQVANDWFGVPRGQSNYTESSSCKEAPDRKALYQYIKSHRKYNFLIKEKNDYTIRSKKGKSQKLLKTVLFQLS
jgi:hypothetical protein